MLFDIDPSQWLFFVGLIVFFLISRGLGCFVISTVVFFEMLYDIKNAFMAISIVCGLWVLSLTISLRLNFNDIPSSSNPHSINRVIGYGIPY